MALYKEMKRRHIKLEKEYVLKCIAIVFIALILSIYFLLIKNYLTSVVILLSMHYILQLFTVNYYDIDAY